MDEKVRLITDFEKAHYPLSEGKKTLLLADTVESVRSALMDMRQWASAGGVILFGGEKE